MIGLSIFNLFSMMNAYSENALAYGWHFHVLFGAVFFAGLVFLIIWAIRVMDKKDLKNWTIWLLVIGAVGVIVTSQYGFYGAKKFLQWRSGGEMMQGEDMMN